MAAADQPLLILLPIMVPAVGLVAVVLILELVLPPQAVVPVLLIRVLVVVMDLPAHWALSLRLQAVVEGVREQLV